MALMKANTHTFQAPRESPQKRGSKKSRKTKNATGKAHFCRKRLCSKPGRTAGDQVKTAREQGRRSGIGGKRTLTATVPRKQKKKQSKGGEVEKRWEPRCAS